MTISFSDIRAFTTLSETMSPEDNFKFINSFLKRMQPVIDSNNGFIDKFLGDAIMALFDTKPEDALKAALEQHSTLIQYNEYRKKSGYSPIKIGIGINTGPLMLGTIGADNRMDGTVISDAVNLASRLESLTKKYLTSIIISEYTYDQLKNPEDFYIRKIDKVKIRGKIKPITIYEVIEDFIDKTAELKIETMELFSEAVKMYREKQYKYALDIFNECFAKNPRDKVSEIYIERCNNKLFKRVS